MLFGETTTRGRLGRGHLTPWFFLLGLKFARLEVGNVIEAHVLLELSFE
jgi:hypothetical protein